MSASSIQSPLVTTATPFLQNFIFSKKEWSGYKGNIGRRIQDRFRETILKPAHHNIYPCRQLDSYKNLIFQRKSCLGRKWSGTPFIQKFEWSGYKGNIGRRIQDHFGETILKPAHQNIYPCLQLDSYNNWIVQRRSCLRRKWWEGIVWE
jgi:hypothetical protein